MPQNDEKVGQKYFSEDFRSFGDQLTRSMAITWEIFDYEAHFFSQIVGIFIEIAKKLSEIAKKVDGFLDNLIWIGNGKLSLLLREYS